VNHICQRRHRQREHHGKRNSEAAIESADLCGFMFKSALIVDQPCRTVVGTRDVRKCRVEQMIGWRKLAGILDRRLRESGMNDTSGRASRLTRRRRKR
jgi:hypothetical protein